MFFKGKIELINNFFLLFLVKWVQDDMIVILYKICVIKSSIFMNIKSDLLIKLVFI